jgi:hypothetical protein
MLLSQSVHPAKTRSSLGHLTFAAHSSGLCGSCRVAWALVPTDHPINQTHEETSYNIRLVIHRVTLRASGGRLFVSCNILGAKWIDKAAGRSAIGKSSSATVRQALTSLSRRSVRLPIIRPSASEKAWPNARASSMPEIEDVYLKIAGDRDYQAALTKARHLFVPGSAHDQMWLHA